MPRKLSASGEYYYSVLGVSKTATVEEINNAFKKKALKSHPKKNKDQDLTADFKFREVNKAHSILSDLQQREIYDKYGSIGLETANQVGHDRFKEFTQEQTMSKCSFACYLFCFAVIGIFTCGYCFCCCCSCCCDEHSGEDKCCNYCMPRVIAPQVTTTQPAQSTNNVNFSVNM